MSWWRKLLDLEPKGSQEDDDEQRPGPPRRVQRFVYTGVDGDSNNVTGIEMALSVSAAYVQLRDRGIQPVSFKRKPGLLGSDPTRQRVSRKVVGQFSRQLAVFVRADVPLSAALLAIADETESKTMKTIIVELADGVDAGRPLAEVAGEYPKAFPPFYVGILRSAELTGELDKVLDELSRYMEHASNATSKIKSAAIYPLIVVGLAIVTLFIVMKYVMPSLLTFFASLSATVPPSTRVLIDMTRGFQLLWPEFAGLLAAIVAGYFLMRRTQRGQAALDRWIFKVPIVGPIVRRAILERIFRVLAATLAAGVPEGDAFEVAALAAHNVVYRDAIRKIREEMMAGYGITRPLIRTGLFPPTARQLFRAGEDTGTLDRQLQVAAEYEEQELETRITRALAALEPALMIVVGGAVLFLTYAIVSAMYGVFSQIHVG